MSGTTIAIYRLPIVRAAQIGHIRVVTDRHSGVYLDGSKVVTATPTGDFLVLTLADERVYYVKAHDYQQIPVARRKQR